MPVSFVCPFNDSILGSSGSAVLDTRLHAVAKRTFSAHGVTYGNSTSSIHSIVGYVNQRLAEQSALIRHTVQPFTESDGTRRYDITICPPEDGHVDARNVSRIVM